MKGLEGLHGPLERYVFGRTPVDLPVPQAQRFARDVAGRLEELIARELHWLHTGQWKPERKRRAAR